MKKTKVIRGKHLPFKPPWLTTIVIWLLLDRLSADRLVWGIAATLLAILWGVWIISLYVAEPRTPKFEDEADVRGVLNRE